MACEPASRSGRRHDKASAVTPKMSLIEDPMALSRTLDVGWQMGDHVKTQHAGEERSTDPTPPPVLVGEAPRLARVVENINWITNLVCRPVADNLPIVLRIGPASPGCLKFNRRHPNRAGHAAGAGFEVYAYHGAMGASPEMLDIESSPYRGERG